MLPEQQARQNIDAMLEKSGWIIQDLQRISIGAGTGVAVREYPTDTGQADYILFVDREPVGVIEAKKEGTILTPVESQTERYASSKLKWKVKAEPLKFLYASTGVETRFTDNRDPKPRAQQVFSFHRPETLREWIKEGSSLRTRLQNIPPLNPEGLRLCQEKAIIKLEQSFKDNRPKALVQMATGSGKTFTAITAVYRLLKFADARRILFLVDTRNLGEQAEQEFQAYKPNDDQRTFTELYSVQRLRSNFIDPSSKVCISTIQRMYSMLRGEELDESAEQTTLNEIHQTDRPKDVVYNEKIPIEAFDFIVVDECHRSIYNLWKQVLDYFDAFMVGLTATPDNRTFAFFNKNVVSEYTHEQAVADGVNVGYDIYYIETEITKNGSKINKEEWVIERERLSRKQMWRQLGDDLPYDAKQLDKDVVNTDQIRTVIQAFKQRLQTEIFPKRTEVPKTLIFAKTDSHADDIIRVIREEFGEGNAFCKKVTYNNSEENPSDVLQQFRTAYYPRIAVTVDMIATGTDVKSIECLMFLRDVRSRNYFQQMLGRGTRTLNEDDLKKVTPSAQSNKTHFVVVDAVGVFKSIKTIDSRPMERKPSMSLKNLIMNVIMGTKDDDIVVSLANRLTRLEKQLHEPERKKIQELTNGKTINTVVSELFESCNPDRVAEKAQSDNSLTEDQDPTPEQVEAAKKEMLDKATQVFESADFRQYIEALQNSHNQIIDDVNIDKLNIAGWDGKLKENASELVQEFKAYIEEHKDTITALQIYYDQPYRRRELTFQMIKDLCETIKQNKPRLAPLLIWQAYEHLEKVNGSPQNEFTALVALIRKVIGVDRELTAYDITVNKNFKDWVFKKNAGHVQFTDVQMQWLRMIKDYIIGSIHIEKEELESIQQGGMMKVWKLFGDKYEDVLNELNEVLAV